MLDKMRLNVSSLHSTCCAIHIALITRSVGRPKHTRVMTGAIEGDTFIGPRAQELRGLLKINYPISHGIVEDWADMERIWQYVYNTELATQPQNHPVLLTEAPLNPRSNRDTAAEIMFERFNVPAFFASMQAVLALYASGRTTGVVLDVGDGVSHAVPVFEGFAAVRGQGVRRMDVAGREVTEALVMQLRRAVGWTPRTSAELEIVRMIKEQKCRVAAADSKEEVGNEEIYELPDGRRLKLTKADLTAAPEVLFNPELAGSEEVGVHQILVDAIHRTDMDLRRGLYSSVVLSGGTTLLRGFGDRLLGEVRKIAMKDVKIKIYAPPERKYSTWIGGSILAGLSTFRRMWVSAEEYAEDPNIIHRKCL